MKCSACVLAPLSAVGIGVLALLGGMGGKSAPVAQATTAAAALASAATSTADAFAVDAVHASVVFRIKHLNVSHFYGRFNKIEGSFNLDKANPSASSLSITIDAGSIDTANADRDKHLKSQDFFSVKEFPSIAFTGKQFNKKSESMYEVAGDLTFHGKTKPITVTIEDTGTGPGMRGGTVAGFATTFTIKRSEFGMDQMLNLLGDDVTVMVGIEGMKK